MKHCWIAGAALLVCLALSACSNGNIDQNDPSEPTPPIEETTNTTPSEPDASQATLESDNSAEPSESNALSEDTIRWFNETYFNQSESERLRNTMLNSEYETAADVNLFELFYCAMVTSSTVTDEERALLAECSPSSHTLDIFKITEDEMDHALVELTGLSLDDTNRVSLEQFICLEDFGAYYLVHGDTNYRSVTVLSGIYNDDGGVSLHYTLDHGALNGTVTLSQAEGKYIFVQNSYD